MFENVGVVGGTNLTFPDCERMERLSGQLLANSLVTFRSSSRYCAKGDIRESDEAELLSCIMAVSKQAFIEVGGFPLDVIPCEENVLINNIQRLGYKIIYNPFAVVYHRRPKLFREYARTLFDYGKGRGIMIRKNHNIPKTLWKPGKDTFFLFVGALIHYASYISGLVYGVLKGK